LDVVELVDRTINRIFLLGSGWLGGDAARRFIEKGGEVGVNNGVGGMSSTNVYIPSMVNTNGITTLSNQVMYGYYPYVPMVNNGGEDTEGKSYYFNLYYRMDSMYDLIVLLVAMVMVFIVMLKVINYITRRQKVRGGRVRRRK
jgi:hypothetical protein